MTNIRTMFVIANEMQTKTQTILAISAKCLYYSAINLGIITIKVRMDKLSGIKKAVAWLKGTEVIGAQKVIAGPVLQPVNQ